MVHKIVLFQKSFTLFTVTLLNSCKLFSHSVVTQTSYHSSYKHTSIYTYSISISTLVNNDSTDKKHWHIPWYQKINYTDHPEHLFNIWIKKYQLQKIKHWSDDEGVVNIKDHIYIEKQNVFVQHHANGFSHLRVTGSRSK